MKSIEAQICVFIYIQFFNFKPKFVKENKEQN